MKKEKTILFLLLFCLLLTACAGPGASSFSGEAPEDAKETLLPTPAEAVPMATSFETEPDSPEPVPNKASEGVFPLLAREDVSLDLIVTRDPQNSVTDLCLHLSVPQEEGIDYRIDDLVINDCILLDKEFICSGFKSENLYPLELGPLLAEGILSWEDLRSFRCHIQSKTFRETEKGSECVLLWEEDCAVTIPEGFQPGYVFLPCLGALAGEQILCDDGTIRVTLLGLGMPGWDILKPLAFLLRVENRGEEPRPFDVTAISVNGTSVPLHTEGFQLQPGTAGYCYGYSYLSDLSENDITAIHDLALLLLTDEAHASGTKMNRSGKEWYLVDLISSALDQARPENQQVFFENDWVRIGFADFDETVFFDGTQYFTWRLLVENLSDTNLELVCSQDYDYYIDWDNGIRAGGWRYVELHFSLPEGVERPDLWVRFMGQSFGGGRLLFQEEEPVLLPTGTESTSEG